MRRYHLIPGCLLLSWCSMAVATNSLVVDPMASCRDVAHYFSGPLPPADALVTLTLSLHDDGRGGWAPKNFAIYADVTGDNGGLAAFGVELLGEIESLHNLAPVALYTKSGQAGKLAGFTQYGEDLARRQIYGITERARGSQLIPAYGLGRTGGDMSALAPEGYEYHDFSGNESGPIYNAHLLLGVGSYLDNPPAWSLCSANNKVAVFEGTETDRYYISHIALQTADSPIGAVPEPGALLAILSAFGGLIFRTRRPMRG